MATHPFRYGTYGEGERGPDVRLHGSALKDVLRELGISSAHIGGESLGGVVAPDARPAEIQRGFRADLPAAASHSVLVALSR